MAIPTRTECYRLIFESGMLDHIVAHSLQVSRVALLLTDALNASGADLDRPLIRSAALLHDITKTRSLETGERHSETGAEFLQARGYPEVADIVRQHVRLDQYPEGGPVTPAEVVNYADKRVLHDRVAPLDERLGYILERYGTDPTVRDRIERVWRRTRSLEIRLFHSLPFSPQDLGRRFLSDAPDAEKTGFRKAVSR
ncbi:MAG: HD domain-containing protein [Desulfococcaceae bacterium]